MTRNEANRYLAAILETVAAVSDTHLGAPEGVMYAALMNDLTLGDFQELLTMCASVGLVTRQNHEVTITAKGRAIVAKIVASRVQVIA